jgi:hypothetical protein
LSPRAGQLFWLGASPAIQNRENNPMQSKIGAVNRCKTVTWECDPMQALAILLAVANYLQ